MMAKSMTVEQVKKEKMALELEVLKLFKEFENKTSLKITYIDTMRKKKKNTKSGEEVPYQPYSGELKDVNINIDIDFL